MERDIQAKIRKKIIALGGVCAKMDSSLRGWPDLTAILPGGTVLFLEVKTPTGRVSKIQAYMHNQLREVDANVHVVRSVEDVTAIIERLNP